MSTDTPTPRAVLADNNVRNAFSRLELCARVPAEREDDDNYLVPQERAVYDAIVAALAASAGPLAAERLQEVQEIANRLRRESDFPAEWKEGLAASTITNLLTAYTALAAELALLNARRDEFTKGIQDFARLTADLAALRATVAEYREVIDGFVNHGESLGYSHPHLAAYRAYPSELWDSASALLARTPTPEGQG